MSQWSWLGNACQQWMPVATSEGWFRPQYSWLDNTCQRFHLRPY